MTPLVAVLVAAAVLVLGGPPVRRGVLRRHRGPDGTGVAGDAGVAGGAVGLGLADAWRAGVGTDAGWTVPGARGGALAGRRAGGTRVPGAARPGPGADVDLAGVLHAVASQLRSGVPPADAWRSVLGVPGGDDGTPPPTALLAAGGARRGAGRSWRRGGTGRADAGHRARVRAVLAGTRVAAETGAPLADVLADLAGAVAADAEQSADVAAALAGPRATARVLVLLPVLGLLVGAAIGARPWQVLTDGGLGSVLGVAGLTLVAAGHAWVRALLRHAVAT